MSDQHPSVEDEVERALRLGLATASQLADRYVRARQDLAHHAQHRSEQEGWQLEARYRAEGASATARLALVDRTEWWDHAAPADITSMWQLAVQWEKEQPRAAIAAETIARQVHDRYGVDTHALGVEAEAVDEAVMRLDAEQRERPGRPRNHDDVATAVAAVVRAEQRDAALVSSGVEQRQMGPVQKEHDADRATLLKLEAEQYNQQATTGGTASLTPDELQALAGDACAQAALHRSEVPAPATPRASDSPIPHDSVERREQTAARLVEIGVSAETVAVAMRADVAHARTANEAVTAHKASRPSGARGVARMTQRRDFGR